MIQFPACSESETHVREPPKDRAAREPSSLRLTRAEYVKSPALLGMHANTDRKLSVETDRVTQKAVQQLQFGSRKELKQGIEYVIM